MNDPFGKKMSMITVSRDKKRWILYYPEIIRKSSEFRGLNNEVYTMQWFNSRTGLYDEKASEFKIENNTLKIPVKPNLKDWRLVLKQK